MSRYQQLFDRLGPDSGTFVPFVMLGDPTLEVSEAIIDTVVAAGADALELGIPFSDPVADGPTIASAHVRALAQGMTVSRSFELIARIRAKYPQLPIGLLVYSNMVVSRETMQFYAECAAAGVDSVLVPDVPIRESAPLRQAAAAHDIAQIFIAPAGASATTLAEVAKYSQGYIYAISRDGVTGTQLRAQTKGLNTTVEQLRAFGGAPVFLGFGISTPAHVHDAIAAGAAGAISGSALTAIVEKHLPLADTEAARSALLAEVASFVTAMKQGTILGNA